MLSAEAATFVGQVASVLVKTGSFSGLNQADAVKVDGISYKVLGIRQVGDGATTRIYLGRG